ncbi:DUF2793 domain-containing protein [Ruixingdingia sedimenti]|uniref:DUF2793 domain-containing protein n=1 Tax=Ruixingdingia sedimenti TaxID=3073604 RepID=A0ABU1F4J8_9RHOB|nr:DUF2793 domain-containing protein [Xinfangfangia sp. LG-4]MDR5651795.1 DUF2793 domain-containing protein [Xinfangfangia sp. LG-4]
MTETTQLGLPLLLPSQAQKHVTVNEALARLDGLVQAVVADRVLTAPPADPAEGEAHIVAGPAPTGDWEGWEGDVAVRANGAWLRLVARAGWRVWSLAEGTVLVRTGAGWQRLQDALGLVDADALAAGGVERLGINAAADATNGFVFRGTNALLHSDGSIDATLNKAAPGGDASLSFKTGWSARALLGLLAGEDFSIKVSADGASYAEALRIAAATGAVTLGQGARVAGGGAAEPGLAFAGDTDTGLTNPGANQLGLVAGGVQRAVLGAAGLNLGVPLTGTAVVSGAADATAGRVLTTGYMGLGGIAPLIGNAAVTDNSLTPGTWRFDSSGGSSGGPAVGGVVRGFLIHNRRAAGGGEVQVLVVESAGQLPAGSILTRSRVSAGWSEWAMGYGQANIVGTVSQTGGLPTGRLIERGANANGSYIRWADGTQTCWHRLPLGSIAAQGAGTWANPYRTASTAAWTFPVAFSAAPQVTGRAIPPAGADDARRRAAFASAAADAAAVYQVQAVRLGDSAAADMFEADLIAVGRWY